jgi:hypothetical protein
VEHARSLADRILAVPRVDYESERARLAELIDALADPDQMEEARLRKIAERKKAPPPSAGDGEKPESESAGDGGAGGAAKVRSGGSGRGTTRGRRRGGGGPWRWLLPLIIVLLLLLGLGALLVTGTIPNRWFGEDTETDAVSDGDGITEDGQEPGGPEPVEPGPGEAGPAEPEPPDDDGAQSSGPPEWEEQAAPALRALEDTPGVIVTRERVIGPGGIEITIRDIITLVNRIATDNGYARMDAIESDRPDPDWIYPGNLFVLPNGTRYTVVRGDTLWEITVRYMVARLAQDYENYLGYVGEYDATGTTANRRDQIAAELERISEESHSENFQKLVREKLNEWRD